MTKSDGIAFARRDIFGLFAGIAITAAAPVYANTPGYLKRAGNIRRIRLRSGRTGESIDTIYWIEGKYIKPALEEVNYFMRDWREDAVKNIDRRQIDLIAATHHMLNTEEPFQLLSGYRSARTNAILRSRSRRVAQDSYHVKGMATDLRLRSRSVGQMAHAALTCRVGGVGIYSRSNFVHMDCGPIRKWGR